MIIMNWLDLLLSVILFLHIISGYMRGLFKQLFDMFGFFIVIIVALWGSRYFSASLAEYINPEDIIPHHDLIQSIGLEVAFEKVPQFVAGILAFLILFLLLSVVFRLFSGGFRWVNRIPLIGFLNRIGGVFAGALVGSIFIYIIVAAVAMLPLQFFIDALNMSQVALFVSHNFTPFALEIKEMIFDFYIQNNG